MAACDESAMRELLAGRPTGACVMIIFGASGDLTKRKLIPALYNLRKDGLLPKEFAIVGCGRTPISREDYQKKVAQDLREFATSPAEPQFLGWLRERVYYNVGDIRSPATFKELAALLAQVDKQHGTGRNYFYYLATAPDYFAEIVPQLGAAGLTQENGHWRRFSSAPTWSKRAGA